MFQRQYEDDADVLDEHGEVLARGYPRLVLMGEGEATNWRGTFRVTDPPEPPSVEGDRTLRLRGGVEGQARLEATEDLQGESAGRAGTFFEVTGVGPAPF
ncbi:MAG: hypothetical protein AB7I38_09835 [Dehalococcoidia bacterium]